MVRLFISCFFLSLTGMVAAQSGLDVAEFQLLTNDMTARTIAPERDANGELAAVIKVVTSETGFDFEAGSLGISKVVPKVGEYWVYVPAKSRSLTIKHPQLGILRNYAYSIPITSGSVYELMLVHGEVEVSVKERQILTEFVIINSEPLGADVYLNNEPVGRTPFSSEKPEGRYEWRVSLDLYQPEAGVFDLKAGDKVKIDALLNPDFGSIEVISKPESGASITFNGYKTNETTPATLEKVPTGEQTITLSHEWYETTTKKVTVVAGQTEKVNIDLKPNFAELTIEAKSDESVYLNDSYKSNGDWIGRLTPGVYRVELRKAGHRAATRQVTLSRGDKERVSLTPEPILSSLKVLSEPMEADIYLNGTYRGTTPHIVRDLLVGEYKLELRKEDYKAAIEVITIIEGETVEINKILERGFDMEPEMVYVEGGTFMMGCTGEQDGDCHDDEKPMHSVIVSSFQMGKYEVTQADWSAVMGSSPSRFGGCDSCPVENVSWNDVQKYIRMLNWKTGKNYRLPTEAEWEYAARGGGKSKGYKYAGSNTLSSVAWYWTNSDDKTHRVGQKSSNELGLYDMSGNVWEWCEDWKGEYPSSSQTNPKGLKSGADRVLRGGSWNGDAGGCRVSIRNGVSPDYRNGFSGFRLVLPVDQ